MDDKILFVDDDELILSCFERLFRRRFNLETALGPDAAIAAMTTKGPYSVVVSDMRMPGCSGLQLLAGAKVISPATVGILFTGNGEVSDAQQAIKDGTVFRLLEKPCEPEVLLQSLEDALRQHQENLLVPLL